MNVVIYIRRSGITGNGGGELGSFWGDLSHQLIGTGVQTGAGLLAGWLQSQQQAGGTGGAGQHTGCNQQLPMHTQGTIAACLDDLSAQWRAAGAAGATPEQLIQILTAFLQMANDGHVFAQGGDTYLAQAKQVWADEIARLRGLTAAGTPQPVIDPATGQPVVITPTTGLLGSGISLETVLIGAGVLMVGYAVLR